MSDKEFSIYFRNRRHWLRSILTKEHDYLLWKYVVLLRKEESARSTIMKMYYQRRKNSLGAKLGIMIPSDVFADGLHIWHYGNIIVNGYAKVGKNCSLHGDNCIGNDGKSQNAPVIGDNVDIGFGSVVIGDVFIADDIIIGAGSVVNKSFYEKGITIAGIPAKKIK